MTYKLFLLCCLILPGTMNAHAKKKPVVKDEVYSRFITSVFSDHSKNYVLRESAAAYIDTNTLNNLFKDSLLTPADVAFMKIQLKQVKNHHWKPYTAQKVSVLPDSVIKSYFGAEASLKAGLDRFRNDFGTSGYYILSVPLFSCNGTLCICYSDFYCGPLCGHGSLAIYRKQENGWQWVRGMSWVS